MRYYVHRTSQFCSSLFNTGTHVQVYRTTCTRYHYTFKIGVPNFAFFLLFLSSSTFFDKPCSFTSLVVLCFDASLLFDLRRWWVLYSLPCMLDTHCGDVFFSFQFHPIQQNHAHRRHLFFERTFQFNWSIGACVVLKGFRNVIGFFIGVTSSLLLPVKFWYYR